MEPERSKHRRMEKGLTLQFKPSNFPVVAKTFTDKTVFLEVMKYLLTVDETRKGAQLGNHAN